MAKNRPASWWALSVIAAALVVAVFYRAGIAWGIVDCVIAAALIALLRTGRRPFGMMSTAQDMQRIYRAEEAPRAAALFERWSAIMPQVTVLIIFGCTLARPVQGAAVRWAEDHALAALGIAAVVYVAFMILLVVRFTRKAGR